MKTLKYIGFCISICYVVLGLRQEKSFLMNRSNLYNYLPTTELRILLKSKKCDKVSFTASGAHVFECLDAVFVIAPLAEYGFLFYDYKEFEEYNRMNKFPVSNRNDLFPFESRGDLIEGIFNSNEKIVNDVLGKYGLSGLTDESLESLFIRTRMNLHDSMLLEDFTLLFWLFYKKNGVLELRRIQTYGLYNSYVNFELVNPKYPNHKIDTSVASIIKEEISFFEFKKKCEWWLEPKFIWGG